MLFLDLLNSYDGSPALDLPSYSLMAHTPGYPAWLPEGAGKDPDNYIVIWFMPRLAVNNKL